jgi:hypothetical protein
MPSEHRTSNSPENRTAVMLWDMAGTLIPYDPVRLGSLAHARRPHDDDIHVNYLRARRRPLLMKPS